MANSSSRMRKGNDHLHCFENLDQASESSGQERRGLCIWLTGRPCSGKSTIASSVGSALTAAGRTVTFLDGDDVRPILCPDLGFSEEARLTSLRRIAFVAREVVRHGGVAIVATVSPFDAHRKLIRASFNAEEFLQVYASASLAQCERRDVKGMYARARRGEVAEFTGIASPYEEPADSEIECDTESESVRQSVAKVVSVVALRLRLSAATPASTAP